MSCTSCFPLRPRLTAPEAVVVVVIVVIAAALVSFGGLSLTAALELLASTGVLASVVVALVSGAPVRAIRAIIRTGLSPAPAV
ncbi:hypothetical protein ACFC0K_36205 [Streptomyces hydrogenans]|uniref:hypothetical protein n=1 Tax=Streptomyces hydrogenans TaxID=1873719 RepID=UPI0035D7B504